MIAKYTELGQILVLKTGYCDIVPSSNVYNKLANHVAIYQTEGILPESWGEINGSPLLLEKENSVFQSQVLDADQILLHEKLEGLDDWSSLPGVAEIIWHRHEGKWNH